METTQASGLRAWIAGVEEAAWRRHANPWSVYTRFAAIPLGILAIWSRAWIGAWAWVPVGLVILWVIVNPVAFAAVHDPRHWISKGIYGERLWLKGAAAHRRKPLLNALVAAGAAGLLAAGWGVYAFNIYACIAGAALTTVAQLWRIWLFAKVYDESGES